FWDKGYFDGVVGVIGGENATIVQISPNLGYHISPAFSLGIGPIISLQQQNKSFNTNFGVRSFAKLEVYKQLGYVQVEHQLTPVRIDYENVNLSGNVLIGGGLVKKIYNKIAVNFSLLYRIHSTADIPGVSPWVFRLGISSVNF
ncbi:MAG: hypothetical protein ACKO96_45195, partial [Flammeovirgaceae bacterium]